MEYRMEGLSGSIALDVTALWELMWAEFSVSHDLAAPDS